ncbi:hypothetical protein BVG16_13165 [Paenibacillus selenitireducens]|uniref:Beta-lactamase-related domain-containing protein n=1 Tax=Paenibacillus selenitireducens TaxID=1324314 RepID=A0A1T2XC54_9BACL|nr:serine hydrolase domain-containing protein [Paenibacillus selenitireducens]OPA77405.1 hypothetical protein BVG16_13165 [Paenibacillus selenitireducens]
MNKTNDVPERTQRLNEYSQYLARKGDLNGSVLIAEQDQILMSQGFGQANMEHHVPCTPKTKFRIGSITKSFTAVAILLLQEKGLLHVQHPVATYLPTYPHGDRITLHHLLTHTSGIPCFTNLDDYNNTLKSPSKLEDTIARFRELPLEFEPGTQFNYSNSGYVLLSYLIEQRSGVDIATFIQQSILEPLEMMDTGYDDARSILSHRASGYEMSGGVTFHAEYIDMSIPSGAGGMYSTTEDVYKWDQALRKGQVLSPDSWSRMTTPYLEDYGYGICVMPDQINGLVDTVMGHAGEINGFLSDYRHYVQADLTVIILSNLTSTSPAELSKQWTKIVLGEELDTYHIPDAIS